MNDLNSQPSQPSQSNRGLFVLICGPSGVGKGTIMKMLKEEFSEFEYVLSHTTRQMRPGEKEGEVYHFISKPEFEQAIAQGKLLEWAQVHAKEYYGVLREPVEKGLNEGKIVVRELDLQGVRSIKAVLPAEDLLTIMIMPKDLETLRERILGRGALPEEEVERRLASAKVEIDAADEMNYRVMNLDGQIEKCFAEVVEIIQKEAAKKGLK